MNHLVCDHSHVTCDGHGGSVAAGRARVGLHLERFQLGVSQKRTYNANKNRARRRRFPSLSAFLYPISAGRFPKSATQSESAEMIGGKESAGRLQILHPRHRNFRRSPQFPKFQIWSHDRWKLNELYSSYIVYLLTTGHVFLWPCRPCPKEISSSVHSGVVVFCL